MLGKATPDTDSHKIQPLVTTYYTEDRNTSIPSSETYLPKYQSRNPAQEGRFGPSMQANPQSATAGPRIWQIRSLQTSGDSFCSLGQ